MHRFFFHLHECGVVTQDEEGRMLPSFEVALEEAVAAARDLMAAEVKSGRLCLGCHIEIVDAYGITLAIVPFDEAVSVSGFSPGALVAPAPPDED